MIDSLCAVSFLSAELSSSFARTWIDWNSLSDSEKLLLLLLSSELLRLISSLTSSSTLVMLLTLLLFLLTWALCSLQLQGWT